MQDYKVQLDSYSGPLDLLLYLIRRDEVDVYDIPISGVLEQYLEYVRLLEVLDPDVAGDFLVLAATLMEIKSRMLLPKPPPEVQDEEEFDPRADLVRQLLAYKEFRDAAGELATRADQQSRRFSRPPIDLPESEGHVDIEDAQVWDLMAAFNKLLAAVGRPRAMHEVHYDDTPITLHAADILDRLEREGPSLRFERIFEGRTVGEMIGLFLALLELIRQDRVRVDQPEPLGAIGVHLIDATPITTVMDTADHAAFKDQERVDQPEPEEEAPFEEETSGAAEPVFEEDDPDEEDDEFHRRIEAVEVGEVDLGRLSEPSSDDEGEPATAADETEEGRT